MCKDQESIQSSTTPDLGYQWESDSFLPSVVCDWNNIPDDRRNVDSVIAF